MIRLMIVDDHPMVREGFKLLLEQDSNIIVVEQADNGKDCLLKLRKAKPDIILLDMNMPEMTGIELLQEISHNKWRPKILMLTASSEIEYLMSAVDNGVDGYLLKSSDAKELVRAVKCVSYGEKFIQPSLIPVLNSKLIARDLDREKVEQLSNREIDVLKLVSVGMFNKEIGEHLNISERTVKNHLSNIFRKIDCSDRTQAAVFCIRNGLVSVHT